MPLIQTENLILLPLKILINITLVHLQLIFKTNTFKDYYTPINNIFVPKQTNIPEHLKYLKLPNQQISLIGVKGANPDETVEKIGAPTFGTDIDGTNYNITYFPIQDSATGTYMQTINALNSITSSITLL